jgi:pimeloyl-ACP methyl ester carboxylesterase
MKTFQLRPLRAALALACGLAATGGGALAQAAAPGEPAGRLAWHDCPYPIPGEAMRCGTLHVPENYAEPDGRQVALPVAVLPATSGRPSPDPIIYLNGGPGHSAMSWLAVMAGIGAPRASRDLVVLEQRGNGTAEPSLVCGEDEEVRACHDRLLAERIDLAQYGNANAARDVEALRRALGASQVNLYGISYGTTLAMHVMRMFPGGLRSVVLDSASAPDADITVADVRSQLDGIGRVLAACEADQACGTRFPDLRSRLLEAVERLDAIPLAVESDAVRAIVGPEVTGQTLVGIAARAPQSGVLLPRTPALLDALMRGDEARVAELLDGPLPKTPPGFPPEKENSLGLTLSIYCAELPHSRFGQVAIDAEERWPASFEARSRPTTGTSAPRRVAGAAGGLGHAGAGPQRRADPGPSGRVRPYHALGRGAARAAGLSSAEGGGDPSRDPTA